MNENSIFKASDMITKVFNRIEENTVIEGNKIVSSWKKTVETINPDGEKLACHSKVSDFKNGILLIETDHPGWIQLLKIHEKYILNGLRRQNSDIKIYSLAFKLEGTDAHLVDKEEFDKAEKEKFTKKIEDQEKELEKRGFINKNTGEKKELPEKLQNVFERLRNDMLTKD